MAEWINQTFEFGCVGPGVPHTFVELTGDSVQIWRKDEDGNPSSWIDLQPDTREAANQLSIIFKKAARRFEEIGKEMEPGSRVQPEDDPSRPKHDREAWKAAR